MITELQRYQGALLGLAVGDALGTTVEFKPRGSFPRQTEMVGGGVFNLKPGQWTDDTSMALCLAQSLIDCNGFDAKDQMDKYWKWIEEGYMSSNGIMFDIGDTTSDALCKYKKFGNPLSGENDPKKAGNGSIMRLAPIPMFFKDSHICENYARLSSATTHGSDDCIASCVLFADMIRKALNDDSIGMILTSGYDNQRSNTPNSVWDIAKGKYQKKTRDEIKSSGYVIHTLEAALWCFYHSNTFEDGCIEAVNLGEDADTTGAVYGQIAGAYYGVHSIPQRWVDKTAKVDLILDLAKQLYEKRKV